MIGYDYEYRIAPADLRAAGCSVAIRYVMPQTPYWVKALRNAEAAELLAAHIPIVSNFESTADRMRAGASAGHDDAVTLLADWKTLGAPSGLIGWFSADWDVQPSEVSAVLDYLHAAADALGGKQFVGCYGGLRAVAAAMDAGFGGWQTIGWSRGQWDSRAAARQTGGQLTIGGVQVDVDQIVNLAALGAWTNPAPPPAPAPSPISTEDDVSFATGTIAPGMGPDGKGACTVVLPPPANSGAAGWGGVWFSLGSDFADAHVRIAAFRGGVWQDFHLDFVVPATSARVIPLGSPLPTDVEKISITRLVGSENVPLAYLIEAVKK